MKKMKKKMKQKPKEKEKKKKKKNVKEAMVDEEEEIDGDDLTNVSLVVPKDDKEHQYDASDGFLVEKKELTPARATDVRGIMIRISIYGDVVYEGLEMDPYSIRYPSNMSIKNLCLMEIIDKDGKELLIPYCFQGRTKRYFKPGCVQFKRLFCEEYPNEPVKKETNFNLDTDKSDVIQSSLALKESYYRMFGKEKKVNKIIKAVNGRKIKIPLDEDTIKRNLEWFDCMSRDPKYQSKINDGIKKILRTKKRPRPTKKKEEEEEERPKKRKKKSDGSAKEMSRTELHFLELKTKAYKRKAKYYTKMHVEYQDILKKYGK